MHQRYINEEIDFQVINYGKISSKSDIWSFGVCLWEIFNGGRIPYPGLSNEEVAKQVVVGKTMDPPADCPMEIQHIMIKCWKLNPEDRPSFSELWEELDKLVRATANSEVPIPKEESYKVASYLNLYSIEVENPTVV